MRPRPSCGVCGGSWLVNLPLPGAQGIITSCRIIQCEADAEYYAEGIEELCYCADHVPKVMVGLRTTVRRVASETGVVADQPAGGTGVVAALSARESGDVGERCPPFDSAIKRSRNLAGDRDLASDDRDGGGSGQRDVDVGQEEAAQSDGGRGDARGHLDSPGSAIEGGRGRGRGSGLPDGGDGSNIGQRSGVARRRRGCGAVGCPFASDSSSAVDRGGDLSDGGDCSSSGQRDAEVRTTLVDYTRPSHVRSGSGCRVGKCRGNNWPAALSVVGLTSSVAGNIHRQRSLGSHKTVWGFPSCASFS